MTINYYKKTIYILLQGGACYLAPFFIGGLLYELYFFPVLLWNDDIYSYQFGPVIEEFARFIALFYLVDKSTKEPRTFFLFYGLIFGFGYSVMEIILKNINYDYYQITFNSLFPITMHIFLSVLTARYCVPAILLLTVPIHIAYNYIILT
jgi:hypothetical protein